MQTANPLSLYPSQGWYDMITSGKVSPCGMCPSTVDDACTQHVVTSFHTSKAPKICYDQGLNSLAKMMVFFYTIGIGIIYLGLSNL